MDEKQVSYIKFPSRHKKRIMKTQNAMVAKFLRENFDMQPILVSRDRAGHIVAVTFDESQRCFTAHLLGTNKNQEASMLKIGKIFFRENGKSTLFVPLLRIVNDHKGCGIGTLLLKVVENYASSQGFAQMELCSLLSATKLKGIYKNNPDSTSGPGIKGLTYPTGKMKQRYASYFDKNLYFYYSNGFEAMDDLSIGMDDRDSIPLVKRPLHTTDLQFGVMGQRYMFRPTDPKFRISTLHINMEYVMEESVHFDGKDVEKSFVPFKCEASESAVSDLEEFIYRAQSASKSLDG